MVGYNDELRFGRNDLAVQRVAGAYRGAFIGGHYRWGREIQIADVEIVNVEASALPAHSATTRQAPAARIKVGSVIVREHRGRVHEVVVAPGGFLWQEQSRATLLRAIARARRWYDAMLDGVTNLDEIAKAEGLAERYVRRLATLAFLSPKIIGAIADGSAPASLTPTVLSDALPLSWAEQERAFLSN